MSGPSDAVVIVQTDSNGVCLITINRPKVYNALSFEAYRKLTAALKNADESDDCKIIALTGSGRYFTSGNDQKNVVDPSALDNAYTFRDFVDTLIGVRKPLVALVNGPAIGVGVTMLPLFDLVIASDSAFFYAPFSKLGLIPEACSSYTFPRIMGFSKASELLMFNKRATTDEMKEAGIVTQVIAQDEFQTIARHKLEQCAKPSLQTLLRIKSMLRPDERRQKLKEVNHYECRILNEVLETSSEAVETMMRFIQTRQNAKL